MSLALPPVGLIDHQASTIHLFKLASAMIKDEHFKDPKACLEDFNFGADTARVFDDMLDRSVPFYSEIQRMIGEMAGDFVQAGSRIYDLGCSTGNTLIALDQCLKEERCELVGVDASEEMLAVARQKILKRPLQHPCSLEVQNLEQGLVIDNASVVILNLTLQFIRPLYRDDLISRIAEGTRPGGCLLLVEKVLGEPSLLNRLFIKHFYAFKKRNGYTDMEIAQKREALENVLIPYQDSENRSLLLKNGYSACDVFFRWYNFSGYIAIKD